MEKGENMEDLNTAPAKTFKLLSNSYIFKPLPNA